MKYRKLRIAWSVAWGVACLLLIALWVRSYSYCDILATKSNWQSFQISTSRGRWQFYQLDVRRQKPLPPQQLIQLWLDAVTPKKTLSSFSLKGTPNNPELKGHFLGFKWFPDLEPKPMGKCLIIPQWFPVVFSLALAATPWLRWRFSLRTLLIVTTVAAIGMGWIVYAIRS